MTIPADWYNVAAEDIQDSVRVKQHILESEALMQSMLELAQVVCLAVRQRHKIIFCGNGGSFADSQHLAAEFVSRFMVEREPLPAIALGTNNSILSAVGNDYSYEEVFSRELQAIAQKGDVVIAISTSGNSGNILRVAETAKALGLHVCGLTGASGGKLAAVIPCLKVPSHNTARIQESHILIGHILCHMVDNTIVNS